MKLNYTISCINETQSLDEVESMTNLFIKRYHPEIVTSKHYSHHLEEFINHIDKNIYLLLTRECDLITNEKEKINIGYAVLHPIKDKYNLHSLYIEPRRRKQGAGSAFIKSITSKYLTTIFFQINDQTEYDTHCLDYEPLKNSQLPSIDREKLIIFAKKNGFVVHETHNGLFAFITPTTTPPTDGDIGPSDDQKIEDRDLLVSNS